MMIQEKKIAFVPEIMELNQLNAGSHLKILRKRLVRPEIIRWVRKPMSGDRGAWDSMALQTTFSRHYEAIPLPYEEPLNSMVVALVAVQFRLLSMSRNVLMGQMKNITEMGKIPLMGKIGNAEDGPLLFKSDSLGLDVYPELELAGFLLSPESYSDRLMRRVYDPADIFHRWVLKSRYTDRRLPRVLLGEESGCLPRIDHLEMPVQTYVTDPLDGSSLLKKLLADTKNFSYAQCLNNYLFSDPGLTVPTSSLTCIEGAHINANLILDLTRNIFHSASEKGIFSFGWKLAPDSPLGFSIDKTPHALPFHPYKEGRSSFICHTKESGPYAENLASMRFPIGLIHRPIEYVTGPNRILYFSQLNQGEVPRMVFYNGEKMPEWMGALAWVQYSGLFNAYFLQRSASPDYKGFSMTPTSDESLFGIDGHLHLERLNGVTAPARYRASLAIVYKEDTKMNDWLLEHGGVLFHGNGHED